MVHGNSEKLNIAREESVHVATEAEGNLSDLSVRLGRDVHAARGGSLERAFHDTRGRCPGTFFVWGILVYSERGDDAFVSADHTISSESCGTGR
jgi:hypothetical protein